MSKSLFNKTTAVAPSQAVKVELEEPVDKPSPMLTKDQILKSIYQKPMGPIKGKPIIGAGGYKPFKPPVEGTKARPVKLSSFKPLRPLPTWSK